MNGALYGTTYQGGTFDGGVLFRLSDVELPPVSQLSVNPTFSTGKAAASASLAISGQTQPTLIEVFTGVMVGQPVPIPGVTDDAIKIRVSNCRNPHVLQFIYREKLGVDGVAFGGGYTTSSGESYQFTTNPASPFWHTDGGAGRPNAFYDQGKGNPRIVTAIGLTMADQPNFGQPIFQPGAHETWRATAKDYIICNCRVVGEVHWTREVPWIVDLSGGPNVVPDLNRGQHGPPRYKDVSIGPPSDPTFSWANQQLDRDGYVQVPVLLPN